MKTKKPRADDFLPKNNKKKTIKLMRAFTSNLPTTPGHKLERRNELETMCQQLQYMTANKDRVERYSTACRRCNSMLLGYPNYCSIQNISYSILHHWSS